jgi:hypothetical protein
MHKLTISSCRIQRAWAEIFAKYTSYTSVCAEEDSESESISFLSPAPACEFCFDATAASTQFVRNSPSLVGTFATTVCGRLFSCAEADSIRVSVSECVCAAAVCARMRTRLTCVRDARSATACIHPCTRHRPTKITQVYANYKSYLCRATFAIHPPPRAHMVCIHTWTTWPQSCKITCVVQRLQYIWYMRSSKLATSVSSPCSIFP